MSRPLAFAFLLSALGSGVAPPAVAAQEPAGAATEVEPEGAGAAEGAGAPVGDASGPGAEGPAATEGGEGGEAPAGAAAGPEAVAPGSREGAERGEAAEAPALPSVAEAQPDPDEAASEAPAGGDMAEYAAQLRQRAEVRAVHQAFGIATWGAMLATVGLGFIQYYNLYGFFGSREDTPCVRGDAVFGQDQCWGVPWPHRIAWITTTALYTTTFVLSFLMPDPDDASEGNGRFAQTLRLHETLRWIHLAGMVAQVFLGLATSQNWFGLDRANDFEAQRVLASVHEIIGAGTFAALTAAGAIMLF